MQLIDLCAGLQMSLKGASGCCVHLREEYSISCDWEWRRWCNCTWKKSIEKCTITEK